MARLEWNAVGTRFYEAGIDRGVLYLDNQPGVPWTGLTAVEENPSGGEVKSYYVDGVKYLHYITAEDFEATLSAFTYPEQFAQCDGTTSVRPGLKVTQQRRKPFGLSYRTMVGNDVEGVNHGYKIHLIYNALASPSQKSYSTIGEETEPSDFSWNITTRPPVMSGYNPTAHVIIDSRETHPATLRAVEDVIYGNDEFSSRLPTLLELGEMYDTSFGLEVIDNGDGTFTINAPDSAIQSVGDDTVQITWPTVTSIGSHTYRVVGS